MNFHHTVCSMCHTGMNGWKKYVTKKFSHYYYYCYYFLTASEAVKITKWFLSAFPLGIFLIHSTVAGIDTHEIDRVAIALATSYIHQRANSLVMCKLQLYSLRYMKVIRPSTITFLLKFFFN